MIIDTVPGGTGYLAEFSNPEKIHAVLANARRILQECDCQNDSRNACHNCLLPFAAGPDAEHVSRIVALRAINELLGCENDDKTPQLEDWEIEEGSRTHHEIAAKEPASILEKQFQRAFLDRLKSGGCTVDETPGAYMSTARIVVGNNYQWMLTPQIDKGYTKPDFQLKLRNGHSTFPAINIYLDGKAFHASIGCNNIDDDATKRQRIRVEDDELVWTITHADLKYFTSGNTDLDLDWLTGIDQKLHQLKAPSKLRGLIKKDAISQLIELIHLPDQAVWQHYASTLLVHLFQRANHTPKHIGLHWATPGTPLDLNLNTTTKQFLLTNTTPPRTPGQHGVAYISWYNSLGCPGLAIGGALNSQELQQAIEGTAPTHVACTLLVDGSDNQLRTDGGNAWQQWLRLANIIGFLDNAVINTCANIDDEAEPLIYRRGEEPTPTFDVAYQPLIDDAVDNAEKEILTALAAQGIPAPHVGEELPNGDVADLVWPDLHIVSFRYDDLYDPAAHQDTWTIVPYDSDTIATTIKEKTH